MHKSELVDQLAARTSLTKIDAQKLLDSFQEIVSESARSAQVATQERVKR
jgi:nucleoid DNA-binding protein